MRRVGLFALTSIAVACTGGEDPGAARATEGGSTTGDAQTSSQTSSKTSSSVDPSFPTSVSATTTASGSTHGTDDDDTSGSTTAELGSSGGTTGCRPMQPGCACDQGLCEAGLRCVEDVCEMPEACEPDLLEPNDEENAPTLLGEISDDDDDGSSVFGTLEGAHDVDWFRYTGDDTLLANVNPARFAKASGSLRLCKFAECEGGIDVTAFDCPAETESATSPAGRPGCCAPMGIALDDADCTDGIDDDMQVFLRVDQAGEQCVAFELVYHY